MGAAPDRVRHASLFGEPAPWRSARCGVGASSPRVRPR